MTLVQPVSRRSMVLMLARAAAAAPIIAAAGLISDPARAAKKLSHRAVGYQPTPKGDQRCDNCKLFERPSGCTRVESPIAPEAWCRIWVKA
jgi:hypothetical protein